MRGFNRFYTQRIGVLDPYLGSEFSLTEVRVLYELAHRDQPTATRTGARPGVGRRLPQPHPAPLRRRAAGSRARPPRPTPAKACCKLTEAGHAAFAPLQQKSRDEAAALLAGLAAPARDKLIDAMDTVQRLLDPSHEPAARPAPSCCAIRAPATWAGW